MGNKRFRRLPITKLGKIRGILTVTDIIRAISEIGLPQAYQELISTWMTENPRTIKSTESIETATKMMSEGDFGSLLIYDESDVDILRGIVTERDIMRAYRKDSWKNLKLKDLDRDLLSHSVVTIDCKAPLEQAIRKMNENHTHRILTLENGKLHGILTANDITSLSSREREEINENSNFLKSINAQYVATDNVITVSLDSNLESVVLLMVEKNIGAIPILDNDKIVGMLTERVLMSLIASGK